MDKYRKRPVVIEAVQLTEESADVIERWLDDCSVPARDAYFTNMPGDDGEYYIESLTFRTLEGEMKAKPGDWIIRDVQGEFYPCNPYIFDATYEPAED